MTVTIKGIKSTFTVENVKQIGSKQLFKAYNTYYATNVYYSYKTLISIKYNGQWFITCEHFSSTTTRHKKEIKKMENNCIMLNQLEFERIVEGARMNKLLVN